jgi:beta-lactamase class A
MRHLVLWTLATALLLAACGVAIDEPIEEDGPAMTPTPRSTAEVVRPTPGASGSPSAPSTEIDPSCLELTPDEPVANGTQLLPDGSLRPPGPAPDPPPFQPLPFATDQALGSRIRNVLGQDIESYAVVVKNLADGSGVSINADRSFYAASIFKVTVMFEVFHLRSLGLLSFDERLLVTPYYAGFDLGTLPVEVCQTLGIGEALAYMMSVSDNASAVLLQDRVGAGNVNRAMAALGLKSTRLLEEDLPVTAGDMALLLEAIARGEAVDEAASQEMVNLLTSEEIDNGLRVALPEGALVAHKTGNWSNATHDVGIVYSPASASSAEPGATYVIAILSDRAYETALIQEVSRVVWEYYNGAGDGLAG